MDTSEKKDIVIEVPTIHIDVTDMAPSVYHASAKEYYECYISYSKPRRKYSPVPYTLLFCTIELELKASLLKYLEKGPSYAKKFGHHFVDVYKNLNPNDKILTDEEFEMLKKSDLICSNKEFEYFLPIAFLSSKYMPDVKMLEKIAFKLIEHGDKIHSYDLKESV